MTLLPIAPIAPIAYLETITVGPTHATGPDGVLAWVDEQLSGKYPDTGWWFHLEQSDGYIVGAGEPGDWMTDGTTSINPALILDGRVFNATTELRLWTAGDSVAGVLNTCSETLGYADPGLAAALTPRARHQLTQESGSTTTWRERSGFQEIRRPNGQRSIIPCTGRDHYRLCLSQYYRSDPDTGLVTVAAICATGYTPDRKGPTP